MVLVRPTPPPVAVPSTQNGQNVVGCWACGGLGGQAGVMTGTQNATSGTKETAQHARENMESIMHFDGLETGSKWTTMYPVLRV